MAASYKKLRKMLIDKAMKKELCAKVGISTASVTKMGKGGSRHYRSPYEDLYRPSIAR